MSTTTELTNYARFMRNAAPQAYDDFLAAFGIYTSEVINNMVTSTENMSVIQGHAQQCVKILTALKEAKKNG